MGPRVVKSCLFWLCFESNVHTEEVGIGLSSRNSGYFGGVYTYTSTFWGIWNDVGELQPFDLEMHAWNVLQGKEK